METYILREAMGSALPNSFVITGSQGKAFRNDLIERLLSYPEDTCLYIDFYDVNIIDFTGADEFLAILQARLKSGEVSNRYVCLLNLNEQHKANIHQALKARNLALAYLDEAKFPKTLGALNTYLSKTFSYVSRKKKVYSRQMAEDMGIPINLAATRLLNLHNEHLVLRNEESSSVGGKQFQYLAF